MKSSKDKIRAYSHQIAGSLYCRTCNIIWDLRDIISRPTGSAILFVAHPDDEVLFFHTFLKKYHPYVVALSGGRSLFRTKSFVKAMKRYHCRYRIYDLGTDDLNYDLLGKRIKALYGKGDWRICATHNAAGEYGHEMHKLVHRAVTDSVNGRVMCPVSVEELEAYPISDVEYREKVSVFRTIYTSELFVLDLWQNWLRHEHLEECGQT